MIVYCSLEAKYARLFSRCFLLQGVADKPCDVAVLGSPQLEQLEVMGCRDLRTVALPSNSGSWKFLNRLNEQRIEEPVESRQWTVECQFCRPELV